MSSATSWRRPSCGDVHRQALECHHRADRHERSSQPSRRCHHFPGRVVLPQGLSLKAALVAKLGGDEMARAFAEGERLHEAYLSAGAARNGCRSRLSYRRPFGPRSSPGPERSGARIRSTCLSDRPAHLPRYEVKLDALLPRPASPCHVCPTSLLKSRFPENLISFGNTGNQNDPTRGAPALFKSGRKRSHEAAE